MKSLTATQAKRRRFIIHQLCEMSRNGWRNARSCDYLPLEMELRQLMPLKFRKIR